jgi:hypothetical protein
MSNTHSEINRVKEINQSLCFDGRVTRDKPRISTASL